MRASLKCLNTDMDVRPLLTSIEAQPDLWDQIQARQHTPGSPHVDTRSIFLRWSAQQTIEAVFSDVESIDYPAFNRLPQARDLLALSAAIVGAKQIARVMLVSLKPGGTITPHVDEGVYADTFERFHLVLQSDFGNEFHVDELDPKVWQTAMMRPGELWWFNHKRTHWVENFSNRERIHLIMDMLAPDFRTERGQ